MSVHNGSATLSATSIEQGLGMKRTMSCASGGTCSTTASTEALHEHGLPNSEAGCMRKGRHARTISRTSPLCGSDLLISEEQELNSWMGTGGAELSSSRDAVSIWERIVRSLEEKGRGDAEPPCPSQPSHSSLVPSRENRHSFHFQPLHNGLQSHPDSVLKIQKLFNENPKIVKKMWRAAAKEKGPEIIDGQTRSRRENQIWRLWAMSQRHLKKTDCCSDAQDEAPVRTPSPDYASDYPLRTPSPDYEQRVPPPAPLAMPAAQPAAQQMCIGFGYASFGAASARPTLASAANAPAHVGGYYFVAMPQIKQKYRV